MLSISKEALEESSRGRRMGEGNESYEEDLKVMIKASAGAELCANAENKNYVKSSSCVSAYDYSWKGTIDLTDSVTVGELERVGDDIKYHWRVPYNVIDSSGNHAETVWRDVIVEELSLEEFEKVIREDERQKAVDGAVSKAQDLSAGAPSRENLNNLPDVLSRAGPAKQQREKGRRAPQDGGLGVCPKCPSCPKCSCPNSKADCKLYCENPETVSKECPSLYINYAGISLPTLNELMEWSRYIVFIIVFIVLVSIILLTASWILHYSNSDSLHNLANESSIDVQYFHSPLQPSGISNTYVTQKQEQKTPPRFQMNSPSLTTGSLRGHATPYTSNIYRD